MLKHEDISQSPSSPASKVRVTPEELAAAITALQIRKEGQPGTIAIGDAVEELGLDVTPEEVLAEVQAWRQAKPKKERQSRGRRFVLALGLVGILLGIGINSGILTQAQNSLQAQSSQLVPGTDPYHVEPGILALNPALPSPVVTTLAETPDGKTVYCSVGGISVAATSRYTQEAQPEVNDPITEMSWPVVKHGKDLYVRGWTRVPLSKEAAKITNVEIFNKPNLPQLGANPQQVTVRLDGWAGIAYRRLNPDGTGVFVFHNLRLTTHAYEKW